MKVSDTKSSYMRPPKPVYLFFYFLQMGTADRKRFTIFEICHAVTDFHNLYDIYDITPVNENKFLCLQFIKNLLQTFSNFRYSQTRTYHRIFSTVTLDIENVFVRYFFHAPGSLYDILPPSNSISFAASTTADTSRFVRSLFGT